MSPVRIATESSTEDGPVTGATVERAVATAAAGEALEANGATLRRAKGYGLP